MSAPSTPADSPLTIADVPRVYGDLMTPKLARGDDAFLFELPDEHGRAVRLERGRPIALVFGSYT